MLHTQEAGRSAQITNESPTGQGFLPRLEDGRQVWFDVDKFGIIPHKFFTPSYSTEELIATREAVAKWQRLNFGWAVPPITKSNSGWIHTLAINQKHQKSNSMKEKTSGTWFIL